MNQTSRVVLIGGIVALACATPASAEPTIGISETCVYSGARFVVFGNGFDPGSSAVAEVMSTPDPLSGEPLSRGEAKVDAAGDVNVTMNVPASEGSAPVGRSVRFRPSPDASASAPTLLATTPLKTARRNVSVLPGRRRARLGLIETWRVTGLPDGSQLFAHYRHGGRTIARRSLGTVQALCGQLKFNLRVIPEGGELSGRWDLWITTMRRFRIPRRGVYIHRRMTVTGDGAAAGAVLAPPAARLVAVDARGPGPVTTAFAADATRIGSSGSSSTARRDRPSSSSSRSATGSGASDRAGRTRARKRSSTTRRRGAATGSSGDSSPPRSCPTAAGRAAFIPSARPRAPTASDSGSRAALRRGRALPSA